MALDKGKESSNETKDEMALLESQQNQLKDKISSLRSLRRTGRSSAVSSLTEKSLEEEIKSVVDLIHSVEEALNIKSIELLKNEQKLPHISKVLYNHDWKGIIEWEKVSSIPTFPLRGRKYLNDGVKISSHGKSLFYLRGIQMISPSTEESFQFHVAKEEWCGLPKYPQDNEWLILNYLLPGETPVQIVALFTATLEIKDIIRNNDLQFDSSQQQQVSQHLLHGMSHEKKARIKLIKQFWKADPEFCNARCKMIPHIVEGPWAVTYSVGQKPVILGNKLDCYYYRGFNYFEIDIDLSSSIIASQILGVARGASKELIVDLGITIQGESEDELPESILGQVRFDHVDIESATSINGKLPKTGSSSKASSEDNFYLS